MRADSKVVFMQMSPSVQIRHRPSAPDPHQLTLFGFMGAQSDRGLGSSADEAADASLVEPSEAPSVPEALPGRARVEVQEPGPDKGAAFALLKPESPPANLEEVIGLLDMAPRASGRYRSMKSAARTVARVLDRRPADVPTDPAILRELLAKAAPAAAKVKPTHWSACRSRLLAALSELGIDVMPGRYIGPPSHEWTNLMESLPDKGSRAALSRLVSFFTREGLSPSTVDASHLGRFERELQATSLRKSPAAQFRKAIRAWDRAREAVPGWPNCTVELQADPRRYAIDLERFPQSFRDDLASFLADSGDPDPFSDNYTKRVRPITVALRRRQLHQVASALVASGKIPIDQCTSLAVLVKTENAKAALRHLHDRKGRTTPYLGDQAQLLRVVAKYWVKATEDEVVALGSVAYNLTEKQKGMVAKNRERLRQFDLPDNRLALLTLPSRIMADARRSKAKDRDVALKIMLAVAVELLLVAPMRINNLAGLQLDRHVLSVRRGERRVWHIVIPGHETKNGVPFELALPPDTGQLLFAYLDSYRPSIADAPGPYLFPSPSGGRRSNTPFAKSISDFIFRETGLKMNVHLFRHLVGKLYFAEHPEDVETVRRVLGHRSSTTTLRSYAELRTDDAFRRYDLTLAMQKEALARAVAVKPVRGGKS
jgi:integrase